MAANVPQTLLICFVSDSICSPSLILGGGTGGREPGPLLDEFRLSLLAWHKGFTICLKVVSDTKSLWKIPLHRRQKAVTQFGSNKLNHPVLWLLAYKHYLMCICNVMWGNSSVYGYDIKPELTEHQKLQRTQNPQRLLSRPLPAWAECILYISHLLRFNSAPLNEVSSFEICMKLSALCKSVRSN